MANSGNKPYLITVPQIKAKSGHLSFIDENIDLPIAIKRFYWIYDVEEGTERGDHAHLNSDRVIVCLQGTATITIENQAGKVFSFVLDNPSKVLYFPRMHWLKLKLSKGAIFLAASSCNFKDDIVINDYEKFRSVLIDPSE